MYRVQEYNDLDRAAELRSAWNALLAHTPNATFFHSLDWLETYWAHYGAKQRLRLLTVHDGDRVVGIVPLTVLRESTRLGSMRVLTYPQAYWGSYYGPIGPRPQETLRAALDHVRRTRRAWDMLDLRFAPPTSDDPAQSILEMSRAGFVPDSRQTDATSIVDLPATFDEYLATRPPKWRNNYRRWQRRLAERGEVRLVRYRPRGRDFDETDPRWDLYAACEEVASRSWQGSSITGTTITHESVRPFFRDMHQAACSFGAADLNLLFLGERPVAFLSCYSYRGYVYGMRIGYDMSASRDGAGNVLYMRVIEDSIRRGDTTVDLGPGSLEAKKTIYTRVAPIYRRTFGNPLSLRGLLWRAKRAVAATACGTDDADVPDPESDAHQATAVSSST